MLAALANYIRDRQQRTRAADQDGFGQTMFEDAIFFARSRNLAKRVIDWDLPHDGDVAKFDLHPVIQRFGDDTVAVGQVDGKALVVRERLWHGWPDPPRFVFFALTAGDDIWAARDFDTWPRTWAQPSTHKSVSLS